MEIKNRSGIRKPVNALLCVLLSIIWFCCTDSYAASWANVAAQATELALADKPTWQRLLHHESATFATPQGSVTKPGFYLANDGHTHPLSELRATIRAFFNEPASQCVYPARLLYLQSHLPDVAFPPALCEDYEQYLAAIVTNSVSVIYASGYLDNPASMFGHVFLKFNHNDNHALLDNTVSYGANVPKTDNKIAYIIKGIMGGYQGHFANQQYHHQQLTYNESELRDLWEYRLALSEQQITLLAAHLWELNNAEFDYYFFKQNCAYQLVKLLELIIDKPLLAPYKVWSMPFDVIMMLDQLDQQNQVISQVVFHGSRQQALYQKWAQLSPVEQSQIHTILADETAQPGAILATMPAQSSIRIIDTLYDYFAYLDVKQGGLSAAQINTRQALLRLRFTLPAKQVDWQANKQTAPHHAQNTALLQASVIHNSELGNIQEFRFRANYYDLLNINPARIPFSALSTFDLRLRHLPGSAIKLHEFTLFSLVNLNASQTDLPADNNAAWKLTVGYQPLSLACADCRSAYVEGFWGKAWAIASENVIFSGLSTRITGSNDLGGNIAAGVEFGGVIKFAPNFATSISGGHQKYINNLAVSRNYLAVTQRYFNDKNMDIRTSMHFDGTYEYGLSFSFYY